jgi:hypothetical protein
MKENMYNLKFRTAFVAIIIGSALLSACGSSTAATTTTTTVPPTTVPMAPVVEVNQLLTAVCPGIPKKTRNEPAGASGIDIYTCKRGSASVELVIPDDAQAWEAHIKKMIANKVLTLEATLCGEGWTLSSTRDIAESLYSDLRDVGLGATTCN